MEWEQPLEHPGENASDSCDASGKFLKNEENRKVMFKSRRAYFAFYITLIAAVSLFCFLGYGLSYTRVYNWHRAEIEEASRIAQKYDWVQAYTGTFNMITSGKTADGDSINEEDAERLEHILGSLQWDYVCGLDAPPYEETGVRRFIVEQRAGFSVSYLVRYEDIVEMSQVEKDYPDQKLTQMDEHWWYVR